MDHEFYLGQLAANGKVLRCLFNKIEPSCWNWRTHPDKWSLLEVLCHLRDEERWDFKARIQQIFKEPGALLEPFNPLDWVTEYDYRQQDPEETLNSFIEERERSIKWLGEIRQADWSLTGRTRKGGKMSAKELLSNWLAHDYLHIRQINRLKYQYLQIHCGEDLTYAGNW